MARQRLSGKQAYSNFGDSFRRVYEKAVPLQKAARFADSVATDSVTAEGATTPFGHPEYLDLKAGETQTANATVGFVDIRGMTKLSFALESDRLLRVIQGLTEASIQIITDGGGYIGEFTGDGVMAYFGDSSQTDGEAAIAALETISLLLKSVEEQVNPKLKQDGLDPIRVAAGMEFGEVLWSKIGVGRVSQLKPIGTATFLAGKLSQSGYTRSWECKVGAKLADWVPGDFKQKAQQYGPVMVNGDQFSRELYLFNWKQFAVDTLGDQTKLEDQLRKHLSASGRLAGVAAASRIVPPPSPATSGPRTLKDQPFY